MYQVISYVSKAAFEAQLADTTQAASGGTVFDAAGDRLAAFTQANAEHRAGKWVALFNDGVLEKTYQHDVVIDTHSY